MSKKKSKIAKPSGESAKSSRQGKPHAGTTSSSASGKESTENGTWVKVEGQLVMDPKDQGIGNLRGGHDEHTALFHAFAYHADWLEESVLEDEEAFFAWRQKMESRAAEGEIVCWLNINDNTDKDMISRVQKRFDLHPLVREDIEDVRQRPKFEEYDQNIYLLLKMLSYNDEKQSLEREQLSIFLGKDWVLTIQERPGDVFQHVRRRLRDSIGLLRKRGADYLVYGLFSAILDQYFAVLDRLNDRIEELEDALLEQSGHRELLEDLYLLRRQLIRVRKAVWPVRELVRGMQDCESLLIKDNLSVYLRNLLDESMQVSDMVESARELAASLMELHLSTVNTRMGVAMKWLAMVSLTFVPLNLLAAIYGMNFKNMPELQWKYGYFGLLGIMALLASGLLWFFYTRGWFRS